MRTSVVLTLVALVTAACHGSMGPRTVPADRFNYNEMISLSAKQQLLTNLIRMRYIEAPSFVEISSMIDQFGREGQVNGGLGWGTGIPLGADTQQLGAAARWTDRPTITYTPVTGQEFARSLLTPLTPESLFALVQAGWPAEALLGLTVRSINGHENETAAPAARGQADPAFWEVLSIWKRLRGKGALSLRLDKQEGKRNVIVFSKTKADDPEVMQDLARMTELLSLSGDNEYTMSYGLIPEEDQIAILSRSTLEILANLAWYFDVPPKHVAEGRTGPAFESKLSRVPTIDVKYSCERPKCPFVAVKNRGYWFYIEDTDVQSKRVFLILEFMMTLTDHGDAARGPIVSIGGGG